MIPACRFPLAATLFGAVLCVGCADSLPAAPTALNSLTPDSLSAAPISLNAPTSGGSALGGPEHADVSNQGGGGVYAAAGASLVRQPTGLQARLAMPTPASGSYLYPAGTTPGEPEVFTLWIFVFNFPELCSDPCDLNDLGTDKPAQGGAYNGGGHVAEGHSLTIAGRIGVGETPFDHPVIDMAPLTNPATAVVHLAIAPHGELDPTKLPNEFRIPTGSPAYWWVAMFD